MKFIANVLWVLFTGLYTAILYLVLGLAWCISIIGIPFGLQAFKFARLSIWPFGSKVKAKFSKHPIANVIWLIFGGFTEAILFLGFGIAWCVTIIGIPFGLQCFKFAKLSCMPFGAEIK
ncbi:MAG: YccF domain-containing protein [Clostridiales bacterium]|nr:YccF domain-containing protein [Clostridiales bacterium]